MPAIENRKVAELIPYDRNARTHSPEQIEQLVASIERFGFTNPVLVAPDGTVVAGHGRLEAAKAAGLDEVPTLTVGKDWTPEQLRAYVLADNQLALNAGWDSEILRAELADLKDLGFDLGEIGFDAPTLDDLFAATGGGEGEGSGDGLPGGATGPEEGRRTLMERFGLAPFSVLSARGGWWQDRKRAWLALGIESEVGRGGNLIGRSIFERCSIILSGTLGSGGTGAAYDKVRAFVTGEREKGLTDDEIEAEALRISGRKSGDGISGSNRLPAGGNLCDRMAAGEGTKRAGKKSANVNPGGGGAKGAYIRGGKRADQKYEAKPVVAGNGWGNGGPARRDSAFYAKKRAWEHDNGRKISTTEFREKHWDGAR